MTATLHSDKLDSDKTIKRTTNPTPWHREMRGAVVEAGLELNEMTDAVLAVCAAHLPAAPAWQDISTAPKDERVLVFNGAVRLARFNFGAVGWAWSDGFGACRPLPTHWLPLPSPPKQGDE